MMSRYNYIYMNIFRNTRRRCCMPAAMRTERNFMESPIVSVNGLTKEYNGMPALKNVNLSLPRGRVIGLLGPNGSGKTTFIKLLVGLLKPTAGTVMIDGYPVGIRTKEVVSYLPERNSLPLYMTAEQLIRYFADFFPDFCEERCRHMLADLGLPMDKPIRNYSKGMREKVQLIMVMSRNAKLYILDEPIAGVDPASRDYIIDTIIKNRDPLSTVLISTHLIADIEKALQEFVFIRQGEIVVYDAVQNVHESGKTVDALFREVFKW